MLWWLGVGHTPHFVLAPRKVYGWGDPLRTVPRFAARLVLSTVALKGATTAVGQLGGHTILWSLLAPHSSRTSNLSRRAHAHIREAAKAKATDTSLVCRPSTADVVALARDEARIIGGQKVHYYCSHLLRASHPPQQCL